MMDDYEFLNACFIISSVAKTWNKNLFEMRYFTCTGCGYEQLLQLEDIDLGI